MNLNDLLQLPPGAMLGFVLLLWPALWAGALVIVSFAGDLLRLATGHASSVSHKAA